MSIRTLAEENLAGPNREGPHPLISFAVKGDLLYRVIEDTEQEHQALVITLPESVAAKIGYELVREIEAREAQRTSKKVRVKE